MRKKQYSLDEKKTILAFYSQFGEAKTISQFGVSRRSIFYWKQLAKNGGDAGLLAKSRKPKHCGRQKVTEDMRGLIKTYYMEHSNAPYAQIRRHLSKYGYQPLSLPTIGRVVKMIKKETEL